MRIRTLLMISAGSIAALAVAVVVVAACTGEHANLPLDSTIGPAPELAAQKHDLIPTVDVAKAVGWQGDAAPRAAPGLAVTAYARGLDHPRWLYALPNGDVLVAETNSPHFPGDEKGIKGFAAKLIMGRAGAGEASPNKIILLRATPSGVQQYVFLQNLFSPLGMVLVGNDLYVANTDSLLRFPYQTGATSISEAGVKLTDLPGGPIDHHWTKNVVASADGSKLYVSVGSNSNIMENGPDAEIGRADIWEVDRATGQHRVFASGLRNPVGMGWNPVTGALWTSVNERDELGSDLVPDYMTHVQEGAFYGWPYSYYGQHVDARAQPQQPDLVARAIAPDYALGAHTASLGFTFSHAGVLPAAYEQGAFVGQHGSWNRNPPSGYRVIFVPFTNGKPDGMPEIVLSDFLDAQGRAQGRPVGVTLDRDGALLVADDVGGVVWRVTGAPAKS
jgi:glucose/arabinose dehydrogenase